MKLTIACPSLQTWEADTAICYAELRSHLAQYPIYNEVDFINVRSSDLVTSRTVIVREALSRNSDSIFWFDSDILFPKDAVHKLSSHNVSIASAIGRVKDMTYRTYALMNDGSSFDPRELSGLHRIDISGFGCILIKTEVFKKIGDPWFGGNWEYNNDSARWEWSFEDAYFCRKAASAGYAVWADADLSKAIGHKGSCVYYHGGVQLIR